MSYETITYHRSQLYEEVWAEPVRTVAKRYGISDVRLAKICRELSIPLPGVGYWARKAAGQNPPQPPLGDAREGAEELTIQRWKDDGPKLPRGKPEVDGGQEGEGPIVVAATLQRPHQLVAEARKILRGVKPNYDGMIARRGERCLDISVGPASLSRALRIMDALIKGCEKRKMTVEVTDVPRGGYAYRRSYGFGGAEDEVKPNTTRILVEGEWVSVRLMEKYSIERPPIPEPPRGLSGSELESWRWRNMPHTRHVPNGILELLLSARWHHMTLRDGKRQRIENRLNNVVAGLFVLAAAVKKDRAEAEEQRLRRAVEERLREEARRRALEEKRRVEKLEDQVERWKLARDIRAYVVELKSILVEPPESNGAGGSLEESITWALAYADRIDPIARLRGAGETVEEEWERDESGQE